MTEDEGGSPIAAGAAPNRTEDDQDRGPGGVGGEPGAESEEPPPDRRDFDDDQAAIDLEAVRNRAS